MQYCPTGFDVSTQVSSGLPTTADAGIASIIAVVRSVRYAPDVILLIAEGDGILIQLP